MQMIAKNIGIRRARAPFVLCTNVDIIFSRAIFRYLKSKPLKKGRVYRCNRCDVPAEVPEEGSIHAILRYCARHIIQRLGKNKWMAHLNPPGRFWYRNPFTLVGIAVIAQLIRPFMGQKSKRYHSLDTWACGDFTLMHQDDWSDIKGYLEIDAYPIHVDSLALGAAVAAGKRQIIWPAKRCIYHISHPDSWELQDPLRKIYFDVRMPRMDYVTLQQALRHMIQKQQLISNTNIHWGYANRSFTEYRVCSTGVSVVRPQEVSYQHLLV